MTQVGCDEVSSALDAGSGVWQDAGSSDENTGKPRPKPDAGSTAGSNGDDSETDRADEDDKDDPADTDSGASSEDGTTQTEEEPTDDDIEVPSACTGEDDIEVVLESDGSLTFHCGSITIHVDAPEGSDESSDDDDGATTDVDDATEDDSSGGDDDDSNADDDATADDSETDTDDTDTDGTDTEPPPVDPGLCRPIATNGAEPLVARAAITSGSQTSTPSPIFVKDVFDRFRSACGACHVGASLGNFEVKEASFTQQVTRDVIAVMTSSDPLVIMPPGGLPVAQRPENDPIRELYDLLIQWRDAVEPVIAAGGKEPTLFFPPASSDPNSAASPYLVTPQLGAAMTNIGTCIPDPALVHSELTESDARDEFFANASQLPKTLRETDLTSLDSFELARRGVLSYAPTYPLFSDDSGKMRHIRVPRGQSLVFDPGLQEFAMPPNTRFYKTFLKQVKDTAGNLGWRKIETRLIVARPDALQPDGTRKPTALFGTYIWNEAETEAVLLEDPLRNGEPFTDRLFFYLRDESKRQWLIDEEAKGTPNVTRTMAFNGWGRHYAVPGSQRCIDCHRGSTNHSFILGFGPLQAHRKPQGVEGAYEHVGVDELSQLPRFMDYGVITGIDDPDDPAELFPLSLSQNAEPRNDYELTAQAYMVGNCGFCHNPDGLASYENPILKDHLNFWPSQVNNGGIFEFPLTGDKAFSPRIKRGDGATKLIPYITAALDDAAVRGFEGGYKYFKDLSVDEQVPMLAPWRSLIYRNVDAPFTTVHDSAMFPKMPMHVAGFDPRVPRMMAEWMLSLPVRPVTPEDAHVQAVEEVFATEGEEYTAAVEAATARLEEYRGGGRYNCRPVEECLQANKDAIQTGTKPCQNGCVDTRDIVAHEVLESIRNAGTQRTPDSLLSPTDGMPDGTPDRPHWVNTDLTQPPVDGWQPRRADWKSVLFCGDGNLDPGEQCDAGPLGSETCTRTCKQISCGAENLTPEQQRECAVVSLTRSAGEASAVELLRDVRITTDFMELALGERPMTVWKEKDQCELSGLPTPLTYDGPEPSDWFDSLNAEDLSKPLYFQSPGEAIFSNICMNCHGPQADSQGRQASGVALLSGGETIVANLRDGLLAPSSIETEFASFANTSRTTLDVAGRYVGWMSLGGTQRLIPEGILTLVRATQVYGYPRLFTDKAPPSANMLDLAALLCSNTIGVNQQGDAAEFDVLNGRVMQANGEGDPTSALVQPTGDVEMWSDICSYDNPPPVLVVRSSTWVAAPPTFNVVAPLWGSTSEGRPTYLDSVLAAPDQAVIGDHSGDSVAGLRSTNRQPWCVLHPADDWVVAYQEQAQDADTYAAKWELDHPGQQFPFCPPDFLVTIGTVLPGDYAYRADKTSVERWSRRGAINAGLAVFTYLRAVREGLRPKPAYNECEKLAE